MHEKIKEIRQTLGLTLEDFGARLGVARSTISNIEAGRKNATQRMLNDICREFNVNPDYLTGESDQMFLQMTKSDHLAAFFGDVLREDDSEFKKRFISMLSQLTTEDWKLLEKVLDRMDIKKD